MDNKYCPISVEVSHEEHTALEFYHKPGTQNWNSWALFLDSILEVLAM